MVAEMLQINEVLCRRGSCRNAAHRGGLCVDHLIEDEREACAKLAENAGLSASVARAPLDVALDIAAAIRARR